VKTQIIRLDPEDDHHSAREKLRWAKASRVVLIWPGRGRALVRRLDLILLHRQADALGIQLGLVSFDPQVLAIAGELGLLVFDTIERIDQVTWERPGRIRRQSIKDAHDGQRPELKTLPRPNRGTRLLPTWARLLSFTVPVLLTLGAIAASFPSATIVLDPQITVEQHTYEIDIDAVSSESSTLDLQSRTVEVDGNLRIPTTGETSAPEANAGGEVQLTNLSSEEVLLPSGTRLRAVVDSGQAYETTASIELPTGDERPISIRAVEPGPAANLDPGAAWAIEGELGLVIEVQNEAPISGGTLAIRKAVSRSDLLEARELLQAQLQQSAQMLIEQSLTSEQLIVPGSLHISRTLASSQDREQEEIGDSVEVYLSLAFEGTLVDSSQLQFVLEGFLRADLEPGKTYQPASLTIREMTLAEGADGSPVLTASVEASTLMDVDRASLAMRLRGISRSEVDQTVRRIAAGSSVRTLDIRPGWLPFLPLFEFQIAVAFPWEANS
jgi:hypothetical protein